MPEIALNPAEQRSSTANSHNSKLATDLQRVINDAQEMLRLATGETYQSDSALRGQIQTRLHLAKATLGHYKEVTVAKARAMGQATDQYVHENPWKSIGIAAAAGVIAGFLLRRR